MCGSVEHLQYGIAITNINQSLQLHTLKVWFVVIYLYSKKNCGVVVVPLSACLSTVCLCFLCLLTWELSSFLCLWSGLDHCKRFVPKVHVRFVKQSDRVSARSLIHFSFGRDVRTSLLGEVHAWTNMMWPLRHTHGL